MNNKFVFRNLYLSVRCILNVYQRIQTSVDMTLAIKAHFSQNIKPHLTQISLTATDMPMRENDVTLGNP